MKPMVTVLSRTRAVANRRREKKPMYARVRTEKAEERRTAPSPHECRHTAAGYFVAAGLNLKELQTVMGHASVAITMDRYGHLFPDSHAEIADELNAYLA